LLCCFHPSKEGFKAAGGGGARTTAEVSIPLRKVSREALQKKLASLQKGFHPSKEGFKAVRLSGEAAYPIPFPSL